MTPNPHPDGVSVSGEEGRELRALSENATPGPWEVDNDFLTTLDPIELSMERRAIADLRYFHRPHDRWNAALIVAAVNYVRSLLATPLPPTMAPTGARSDQRPTSEGESMGV